MKWHKIGDIVYLFRRNVDVWIVLRRLPRRERWIPRYRNRIGHLYSRRKVFLRDVSPYPVVT